MAFINYCHKTCGSIVMCYGKKCFGNIDWVLLSLCRLSKQGVKTGGWNWCGIRQSLKCLQDEITSEVNTVVYKCLFHVLSCFSVIWWTSRYYHHILQDLAVVDMLWVIIRMVSKQFFCLFYFFSEHFLLHITIVLKKGKLTNLNSFFLAKVSLSQKLHLQYFYFDDKSLEVAIIT